MRTLIRPAGAVAVLAVLSVLPTACADDARSPAAAGTTSEATPVTVVESSVPAELDSGLTTKLGEVMDRFGVPGAVVALEDPDLGSWVATAGVSDVESGEEMTTTLQWPIRSITKSFVVTVLWQLVQEGRVALTDTVDRWVPGIPNGDRVTLGQLADMTSGVPDYTGEAFVEDFTADPTAPFTRAQLLDYVRRGEPSAAPGAERRYINASTVLLGEVIEQVEQRPFAEVLQERIAGPLSLAGTAYPNEVDGFTGEHPT
ncbi:MAG: serine hydrolase domain-containing protein, partial [Microthrixaceae bacterium]